MAKCKQCGDPIRWEKTKRGKWMMLQIGDYEPHYPHCGKNLWTEEDWKVYRKHVVERTIALNTKTLWNQYLKTKGVAVSGKRRKSAYRGKIPPWAFPTFIDCIE